MGFCSMTFILYWAIFNKICTERKCNICDLVWKVLMEMPRDMLYCYYFKCFWDTLWFLGMNSHFSNNLLYPNLQIKTFFYVDYRPALVSLRLILIFFEDLLMVQTGSNSATASLYYSTRRDLNFRVMMTSNLWSPLAKQNHYTHS